MCGLVTETGVAAEQSMTPSGDQPNLKEVGGAGRSLSQKPSLKTS